MSEQIQSDSVFQVAEDLVARLRWEMENGRVGYAELAGSSLSPVSRVRPVPVISDHGDPVCCTRSQKLEELQREMGDCQRCGLSDQRKNIVFGEGNGDAELVFVGEGPGRDEDVEGRPFVGAAGQLLDKIIVAMGLSREDVYICNVVKCRPPKNRVPSPEEQLVCGRFLSRQLSIIEPKIVVSLGGTATQFLLENQEPVGRLRGRFHGGGRWKVMPTYHPAYLLRNPSQKRPVWQDIQLVMSELGLGPAGQKGEE